MEKGSNMQIEIKSAKDNPNREELLSEVVRVEEEAWPEEVRATRDKFASRLEVFPESFFLGYVDTTLRGALTSEIIDFDIGSPPISWEKTTDNGYIKGTHKPDGNALYVVSLGVSKLAQGKGLGSLLLENAKAFTREKGLGFLVLGARIPGYREFHQKHPKVGIEEYVRTRKEDTGEPIDPEIRFYSRNGLRVLKIVPNYMEDDPESENYGAVMVWESGS